MDTTPDYTTYSLFPTLAWKVKCPYKFNTTEKKYFTEQLKEKNIITNGLGNYTSKNNHILDDPILEDFKQECTQHLKNYYDYTYCPIDPPNIYITQSWLNRTRYKENHLNHAHSNSLLSAVYYYKTLKSSSEETRDKIRFWSPTPYAHWETPTKEYNIYNSRTWDVYVSTGDLIVFPSWFQHSVPAKQTTGDRISLAFNSFFTGTMGHEDSLNELTL